MRKSKSIPTPMLHRAAPISVSIALGNGSANALKVKAGGWSTGSSASFYLSHSILICRAPDEKAVSTIFKVFGMTRPGLEPTTYWL